MPKTWNERVPLEPNLLKEAELPRERNPDSSVSPQYEDHVLPDNSWDHEEDS